MAARKREHLNYYRLEKDGSYSYQGSYWHWHSQAERASFLKAAGMLLGGALACVVAAGMLPAAVLNGTVYVLLPYALSVAAGALCAGCIFRLWREGVDVRAHVYRSSVERLTPLVTAATVLSIASALGSVVKFALTTKHPPVILQFGALLAIASVLYTRLWRKVQRLELKSDR